MEGIKMPDQVRAKTCRICKQTKPISEFYKCSGSRGGFRNKCKVCYLEHVKLYYRTKRAQVIRRQYRQSSHGKNKQRQYDQSAKGKARHKRYSQTEKGKAAIKHHQQSEKYNITKKRYNKTEKGRKVQIAAIKRFKIRHPEQVKARDAVNHAIRDGRLLRPDSLQCHYCPAQAKQYHHYKGYAKEHWLDVVPVCVKCHGEIARET